MGFFRAGCVCYDHVILWGWKEYQLNILSGSRSRINPTYPKPCVWGRVEEEILVLEGWWINLLELFEAFLFGLALLCLGVTQELPARPIWSCLAFRKKERRSRDRICEFYPRCFGRKSAVKRTQTIRAYAEFVYLQKPVVGVPVHWCSAINNKGRQQLTTCLLWWQCKLFVFNLHDSWATFILGTKEKGKEHLRA